MTIIHTVNDGMGNRNFQQPKGMLTLVSINTPVADHGAGGR
jgi:hypothetical protein